MSSTRSIIAPPPFAENALTVIPPTPVAGVSYRDPVAGPASSADGWPYAERVNSAEWNQIMFQISTLVSIIDAKGVLGWSSEKDYIEPSVCFGSDGVLYKWLQASGPANGGAQDPTTATLYWQTLASALNQSALPLGYFSGFTLSNNVGAPNTTVDVAPGSARDSADTVDITLTSTLSGILQSSGAWAAGNNQNKLDAGARTNNTWYHKFAIGHPTLADDILFSTSVSAPSLPSGYAGFVLIESIRTDGSGNILPFVNVGRAMTWKTARQDVTLSAVAAGNTTTTISTPPGRRVMAKQYAAAAGNAATIYTHSPDVNNETLGTVSAGAWRAGLATNDAGVTDEPVAGYLECVTGTSSDIIVQTFTAGGTLAVVQLATMGWEKL